jgi:cyclopropane-fatty-acyl-phospholipid synthase
MSGDETLEEAQENKLDYICKKLYLREGERLFDIGCGWGGLMMYAAKHYGVQVVGVTLSSTQAEYVGHIIREAGFESRCQVIQGDFRDINDHEGFDKISSVGAIEHVARGGLSEHFNHVWGLLKQGGLFLSHGITASHSKRLRGPSFVDLYVFPDSAVIPVSAILTAAEEAAFEIRDVESLREHYQLTVRHWLRRFEAKRQEVIRVTDQVTFRINHIYLAALAHYFGDGTNNLHQVLLAKPHHGRTGLPLTRSAWYSDHGGSPVP